MPETHNLTIIGDTMNSFCFTTECVILVSKGLKKVAFFRTH